MKVTLPVVKSELSLQDAVAVLKDTARGALLVDEGEHYRLIDGEDLVFAGHPKDERIETMVSAQPQKFQKSRPRLLSRVLAVTQRAKMAQVEIDDSLAVRYMAEIRLYYCNGPRRHTFLPSEVSVGALCPYGDNGRIVELP